jgi:hypothetical protein
MTPIRTNRLAPVLVLAGCAVGLLLAVYVGGYFVLGKHSANGLQPSVHFDSARSFRL